MITARIIRPIIKATIRGGGAPTNVNTFAFQPEESIAIASGVLAIPTTSSPVIIVQAETGTTDTLTDITTKVGLVMLRADAGDTITITDNGADAANKIRTRTGADVILSETAYVTLYRKTTTDAWRSLDILERIIDVDELTVGSAIDLTGIIAGTRVPFGGELSTDANLHFTSNVLNAPNVTVGSQLVLTATSVQLKSSGGVQGFLRLHENDANGASYIEIIGPSSLAQNYQWVMPDDAPIAGDALKVASVVSDVVTFEFGAAGGGGITIGDAIGGTPANNAFLYADSSDLLQASSGWLYDQTDAIVAAISTSKGARPIPVMTGAQARAIGSPAAGLWAFDSDKGLPQFYNGSNWLTDMPLPGYGYRINAIVPNRSSSYVVLGAAITVAGGGGSAGEQTEELGVSTRHRTATSVNSEAGYIENVNSFYLGSMAGENGFLMFGGFVLNNASYNETGANTGSRIFFGLTTQGGVVGCVNSDDPSGHRIGFSRLHVNGATTDTNWYITTKDGTTETRVDTGLSFSGAAAYRVWINCPPQGTSIKLQIAKSVSGTITYSNVVTVSSNLPGGSTAMRRALALYTIDAVARDIGGASNWIYSGFNIS